MLHPSPGPVQPPALGGEMSVCSVILREEIQHALPSKATLLSVLLYIDGPHEGGPAVGQNCQRLRSINRLTSLISQALGPLEAYLILRVIFCSLSAWLLRGHVSESIDSELRQGKGVVGSFSSNIQTQNTGIPSHPFPFLKNK